MKLILVFLSLLFFFFSKSLFAFDGLTFYGAEITPADRVNSNGNALNSVRDILRQERANYYDFGIKTKNDQPDDIFSNESNRSIFNNAKIDISPSLAKQIVYGPGPVLISVFVFSVKEISVEAGLPRSDVD